MDRLVVLRLQASGCRAEAWLNDMPLAATPEAGGQVILPVHEYLLEGDNRLDLVVEPETARHAGRTRIAEQALSAQARLLLPRIGQPAHEGHARSLAELDWQLAAGELMQPHQVRSQDVALPIPLPRWRWQDLPAIPDLEEVRPAVVRFLQLLALALARGDADSFVQASRLRLEELALAYEQPVDDFIRRWQLRLQQLQASQVLRIPLPSDADLQLRLCASGRLVQCEGLDGEPLLRSEAASDGSRLFWPVRLAVLDGHCHVLR